MSDSFLPDPAAQSSQPAPSPKPKKKWNKQSKKSQTPLPPAAADGGDDEKPPTSQPATGNGDAPDPFAPEQLRLSQDFSAAAGVQKIITTVPCRKPNRHEFIRVRPGEDWQLETAIFEDKLSKEMYLVDRTLWDELSNEIYPVSLLCVMTRQRDIFLWPVRIPGDDARSNLWNDSALAAARLAQSHWIRVAANMNAGYYETFKAAAAFSEPVWPDLTLQQMLRTCFRDHFIDDSDHAVLRALRGEL